ncbi:hypothetical protein LPJ56_004795 [Coemansia sp. RSA 2599]|nr:hypothetical protein LPJ75_004672 [Coemansia sp. RSA 2598]KAJ1814644.1 hypothetical protein LPJ56_004795 [Coemansia sp. RSA 2599]
MAETNREISVVVVGGSYAGAAAANRLAGLSKKGYSGLKVTLVDKSTHYFHAVGFPKALVDAKYAEKAFLPFAGFFEPGSKHAFVQGQLEKVVDAHNIQLDNGQTIRFDYLVIATGAQFPWPINVSGSTKEAGLAEIAELRAGLDSANTVMVVGGGAVGVEVAGYVAATHPAKKVTLVHSGSRLLPGNFREGVSNGAVSKLRKLGVNVVLNERVELPGDSAFAAHMDSAEVHGSSGNKYQTDLLIRATGFRVHSEFIEPLETLCGQSLRVNQGPRFIRVLPTLQLKASMFPNVFVAGDVNDMPVTAKYAFKAEMQGDTAANNIKRMIECGFDVELANATSVDPAAAADVQVPALSNWSDFVDAIMVPIGPDLGVVQALKVAVSFFGLENLLVRLVKSRDFMLWMRKGFFQNKQAN